MSPDEELLDEDARAALSLREGILRAETVWELTAAQVRQLRVSGHMNNYVRAALEVALESRWPRSGRLRVAQAAFPEEFTQAAHRLLQLAAGLESPVGSRTQRLAVTRSAFELYRCLPDWPIARLQPLIGVLAALAFVPVLAERNDGFPLWWHRPVRRMRPEQRRLFGRALRPFSYEDMLAEFGGAMAQRGARAQDPSSVLAAVTIELMATAIIMLENGVLPDVVFQAVQNTERGMRAYEDAHGLGAGPDRPLGVRFPGQIRYRNTLYLYGAEILEQMGQPGRARAWYLRDVDVDALPSALLFNLTAFKTAERLLCAYRLSSPAERVPLLQLVLRVWARALALTREYSGEVLAFVDLHPELDRSRPKLEAGGRTLLYAGEACREPMLASLLYREMIDGVPCRCTDYGILHERA